MTTVIPIFIIKRISKRILLLLFLSCLSLSAQNYNSDPAYTNNINRVYTGNVSETGVNGGKIINNKLDSVNKNIDAIEKPEGWNELLRSAEVAAESRRKEQQRKDSIARDLDLKAKVAFVEKQESEKEKNKLISYLIRFILIIAAIILIIRLYSEVKKRRKQGIMKLNLVQFKKLSSKEIIFLSLSVGLVIFITSGSMFSKTKYFKYYKGKSIEVSQEFSKFELQEFNYMLAIVSFIIVTGTTYFILNRKRN